VNTCGLPAQVFSVKLKRGREKTTRDNERRDMPFERDENYLDTRDRWFNLALSVQGKLVMDKSERL